MLNIATIYRCYKYLKDFSWFLNLLCTVFRKGSIDRYLNISYHIEEKKIPL